MRERQVADNDTERLDKWLWAARFFKTRGLAVEAITGGKVQVSDQRVKPARLIRTGDRIRIRKGELLFEVIVQGLSRQRRPASQAALLYEETEESEAYRKHEMARRREKVELHVPGAGRPTKRNRRKLTELKGR